MCLGGYFSTGLHLANKVQMLVFQVVVVVVVVNYGYGHRFSISVSFIEIPYISSLKQLFILGINTHIEYSGEYSAWNI